MNIRGKLFQLLRGKPPHHKFEGWGMFTDTNTPWANVTSDLMKEYLEAHQEMNEKVAEEKIILSQFNGEKYKDKTHLLQGLMWRHFIVFWSARYAAHNSQSIQKILVECGVCDGLTIFFAMKAQQGPYHAYLYDAWEAMKEEHLTEGERKNIGAYDYLSLENTQRNLEMFNKNCTYIKGYIPESLTEAPGMVTWLHIDLNASKPTIETLEKFYDRLENGGIILFDDYDWVGYEETKRLVDQFFADKKGLLLPIPTGQALFFKFASDTR